MLHISLKLYAHGTSVRSGNTKRKILSGVGNIKADANALPLYFIFDDREEKWEVPSMWQMKKVKEGLNVEGPIPPDTVFSKMQGGQYDLVVVRYHDQGHIPTELIGFQSDDNTKTWGSM